jgi:hypothetical protein
MAPSVMPERRPSAWVVPRFSSSLMMEYSMQGSAITARPIHSRRPARVGGTVAMMGPLRAGLDMSACSFC